MKINREIASRLCLTLIVGVLAFGNATAQKATEEDRDKTKTKQAQAVSKEVYEKIQKAQEMVDEKRYSQALKALNNLYNPDKLTEYEQANVLNYLGFVYYNMDDANGAIRTYEKMLAIPTLEPQMAKQTTFTMAQLYTMEENYGKALQTIDKWFILETNPAPEPFILRAQILYNLSRYKQMVEPIENAMAVARKRELPVKEDWYGLLNFAYFQQENYTKVRDIQKILLQNWPKARYWKSLAGAYTELGQDEKLIYAYDAAHTQGMLEKDTEFVTMAQLYLQAEVPYKAGKLLEEKMNAGIVPKNEKNYRLLSQAWMLAMEDEKSIPALQAAARLATHGELDQRLANAYLNVGNYSECVKSANNAIRKGGLKNPDNMQISLGMCLYNLRKYSDAKTAFRAAARTPRSQRTSAQWIKVIDADVERNRQIRLAEEAARKKRQELDAKKAASQRA
ncbi:MAG: tetratricopeptide repeat protein [Woeseiaceae bacterium]